jgi:hypothetical protein
MNKPLSEDNLIANPQATQLSQGDYDAERRRVLAKVYDLLIRLADEQEHQPVILDKVSEVEGKIVEPIPVQLELLH